MATTIKRRNRRSIFRKILTLKLWFDKGYGITGYVKYIVLAFGLASRDTTTTLVFAFLWAIGCLVLGYYWYKHRIADIENDLLNEYNPFVRQVIRKI